MSTGRLPAVIDRNADPVVERFLDLVASTGNSTAAARAVGLHRNSFYERAQRDDHFRRRWDSAQVMSRRHLAAEVMDKAMVATGRIVEEPLLDSAGNAVLDDDLEPVMIRRLVDADARILSKLLDKLVHSEDGAPVTAVQVINNMPDAPPPPPRVARLVFADSVPSIAAPSITEDVVDAAWEPVQ